MPVIVAHLISSLATGGTEMMLHKLLSRMRGDDTQHVVISLTGGGAIGEMIDALGIPVYSLNMRRGLPEPGGLFRLWLLLRRLRPHVLQTWLYHADLLGLVAGKLAGVPALAWNIRCSTTDERYVSGLTGLVVRALARFSAVPDVIIANSDAGIVVHKRLGYHPRQWQMLPNGFDLDRFVPDQEAYRSVRVELGLRPDAPLVGLIARHDPLKDQPTFLRMASVILKANRAVQFLMAGWRIDGSNTDLTQLMSKLGVAEHVHLVGERHDIPRLTAALDVATCTSRGEGFPNIIGEAMACGVPVVATDVGDAANIIGDESLIAPVGDAVALAAACLSVLDAPAERRRELGALARRRVETNYDLRLIARRYNELYSSLAGRIAKVA